MENFQQLRKKAEEKNGNDFEVDSDGLLCFWGQCCVPNREDIWREILTEAHWSKYSMHPGETKMYQDLKRQFW
jgi:hypothetical protein